MYKKKVHDTVYTCINDKTSKVLLGFTHWPYVMTICGVVFVYS